MECSKQIISSRKRTEYKDYLMCSNVPRGYVHFLGKISGSINGGVSGVLSVELLGYHWNKNFQRPPQKDELSWKVLFLQD